MEKDCWNFDFCFALNLREAAIFILLIYLWDIRKKPVVKHFSDLDTAWKKNKKDVLVKIRTDLTSTLIVNHSFCDWCCGLKGFLSWLAFIFTCSILPGPCWADPENKGVFVKFSILFTATWSSKFVWTPWSFLNSHATFELLKFTQ